MAQFSSTSLIEDYLNRADIRNLLGVDEKVGAYKSCSKRVGIAFSNARDGNAATFYHITSLLEHNIRVLIYVGSFMTPLPNRQLSLLIPHQIGTYDWICNVVGNRRMLDALEWSGKVGFAAESLHDWSSGVSPHRAGQTKSYGGLTWYVVSSNTPLEVGRILTLCLRMNRATIEGASHMTPSSHPVESAFMFEHWIAGKDL